MSSTSSGYKNTALAPADDNIDDWQLAIQRGGCARENAKLQDCHDFTRDWRRCRFEVTPKRREYQSNSQLEAFKKCWAKIDQARRAQTGQKV